MNPPWKDNRYSLIQWTCSYHKRRYRIRKTAIMQWYNPRLWSYRKTWRNVTHPSDVSASRCRGSLFFPSNSGQESSAAALLACAIVPSEVQKNMKKCYPSFRRVCLTVSRQLVFPSNSGQESSAAAVLACAIVPSEKQTRGRAWLESHVYLSIYLSINLSICLSIYHFSIHLSIELTISLSICLSVYLSIKFSLYIYLSLYLSICLSVYLSIYLSMSLPIYFSICLGI